MLNAYKAIVVHRAFPERRAGESKSRIEGQLAEQECKIVLVEGDVCIHARDGIVMEIANLLVTGVEGVNFASKVPLAALRHTNEFDPGMFGCIGPDDIIGTVGRSIADNDPLGR